MSAATSSRSSAIWSRLRSRKRASASARTCRPAPSSPPRTACSTPWSAPTPAPPPAIRFARSCAPANSTTRKSRSRRNPRAGCRCLKFPGCPAPRWAQSRSAISSANWARSKTRRLTVEDSHELLVNEESDKLLDTDQLVQEAINAVENNGIVFLDEIDKICVRDGRVGGDVSREGVQRDLLPLIEGTTVSTKHGAVKTDHILFIASGAFHVAKPSDLLPELQGRLPIRVELQALTRDDMRRILTEPEASLVKQTVALLGTEGVTLEFSADAIDAIADIAVEVNSNVENIGARRLQTVMERVLDEISFAAPDRSG